MQIYVKIISIQPLVTLYFLLHNKCDNSLRPQTLPRPASESNKENQSFATCLHLAKNAYFKVFYTW